MDPPQPCPRRNIRNRRPRTRLQRHRQRFSHARRGCRKTTPEILVLGNSAIICNKRGQIRTILVSHSRLYFSKLNHFIFAMICSTNSVFSIWLDMGSRIEGVGKSSMCRMIDSFYNAECFASRRSSTRNITSLIAKIQCCNWIQTTN